MLGELPQPNRSVVQQMTQYGAASLLTEEPEGEHLKSLCCI